MGGWVGPQDRSRRVAENSCLPKGSDPRTVQPVASRHTAYSTPTHVVLKFESHFLGMFAKFVKSDH